MNNNHVHTLLVQIDDNALKVLSFFFSFEAVDRINFHRNSTTVREKTKIMLEELP